MNDSQTLLEENRPASAPKAITFLRHLVGIAIVLLIQPPSLYSNIPQFLGRWLGSLLVTFAISGIISGLLYLFFTSSQKGRIGRTVLFCSWILAGLQLYGQWVLPDVIKRYSISESYSEPINYPITITSSFAYTDTPTQVRQDNRIDFGPQNSEQPQGVTNEIPQGRAQLTNAVFGPKDQGQPVTDEELQAAGTNRESFNRFITGKTTGPRWDSDEAAAAMPGIQAQQKREQERKARDF